jgi:hypothetical protein
MIVRTPLPDQWTPLMCDADADGAAKSVDTIANATTNPNRRVILIPLFDGVR